ncbi:MAG: glucose-1-phosphate thymidylyltransferase, partial [Moraxellaceae bacterium]
VVNAHIIPTAHSVNQIVQAAKDETPVLENDELRMLHWPWQICQYNDWALRHDFESLTAGRTSAAISSTNNLLQPQSIFIEDGAVVEYCTLNANTGPIYIAANAVIMEGSLIRGPFAAGEGATVKMGSKIYGATTLGPYCVAGGEIKNSVLFGYSNKAHDGYLGDSVLGEWCNLGAGTSNSNVKNTGGTVKYYYGGDTEGQEAGNKAGLLMGDYSRCAINTSFNTGTVVGVCCNIFGSTPGRYVPDFAWGSERYILDKAICDISKWKQMKGQSITAGETELLQTLYLTTP